jgi:hypothetical protein
MSLDRFQSKAGLLQFSAEANVTVTGTASTLASNQLNGGYQFGPYAGIAAATGASTGGGALVQSPIGSLGYALNTSNYINLSATSGSIPHGNAGAVLISVSTTGGIYNIEQAAFQGQILSIIPIGGTTASIASTLNTTGINGTTTAACQVAVATTFASTGPCVLMALAQAPGGTATTNVPFVWRRII